MNGQPLDIQVVYDSSRGGGQRRTRAAKASAPAVRVSKRTLVTLGLLSLLIAAAMYYGTWLKINPFINYSMMLKTPAVDEDIIMKMFRITPDASSETDPVEAPESNNEPRWTSLTGAAVITSAAYTWSTLATLGFCALALAAGSILSNVHRGVRFGGVLLTLFVLFALVAGIYYVWTNFSTGYRPEHLRAAMGGLAALFLAIGLTIRGRLRGLTRLAGMSVILAAIGSAVGLYLWYESGAIEAQFAAPAFLAMVFAIHSLWGWVLLIASWRM